MRRAKHYIHPPKKPYTVTICCCDPPTPAWYKNFDNKDKATALFEKLKAEEIRQLGGGEFTISVWEHGENRRPKIFKDDEGELHTIMFPGAKEILTFSYMDLWDAINATQISR